MLIKKLHHREDQLRTGSHLTDIDVANIGSTRGTCAQKGNNVMTICACADYIFPVYLSALIAVVK